MAKTSNILVAMAGQFILSHLLSLIEFSAVTGCVKAVYVRPVNP